MKRDFALTFLAFGLTACLNQQDAVTAQTPSDGLRPGQLHLGTLASAKSAVEKIPVQNSDSILDFDLGQANGSIQRFFVLKNTGDIDIRNIALATDNPRFYFSPSKVKILQPSKTVPVLQVITLNVVHGSRLEGLGPDTLLAMGNNGALAHITGLTANAAGDSLSISEDIRFEVFAKVLDFRVYKEDTVEVDAFPFTLDYGSMHNFTLDPVRQWNAQGDTLKMVNTGNVSFTLKNWSLDQDGALQLLDSVEVESGKSIRLVPVNLEIDGHGVVSNPFKPYLQPARNGKIYMAFAPKDF